jgi:hypothetical protein
MGALLLVMGVLSLMAIPKLWKRSQEMWKETQGTLVECYVKQGVRRGSDGDGLRPRSSATTYDVHLKYRYAVDEKEFKGDEKAPRQPEDDEKWSEARAIQESYKAGEAIAVYYHPGDPMRSRFTVKEPRIEIIGTLFLSWRTWWSDWCCFNWGGGS